MPTAPVDHRGSVLFYEDSGAPPGSTDYITLVLVHGTCFHSAVYRPMIPFAAEHNLRLVLLNLRDYPGSTPYSAEDVEDLRGPSCEAQDRAIRNRGLEIATFIRWFIETEAIPPIKEVAGSEALVGGLSLLSWSGGNCAAAAMFAHADKLPEDTRQLFDAYLRSFIMYDPSSTVIGQPLPPGLSALKRDPSAPPDVQVAQFSLAVSSYYPAYTFPENIDPPATYDPPRRPVHESAEPVSLKYTPTTDRMSPEVLRSLTHAAVMEQNQHLIWGVSHDVYRAILARALFDCRFDDGSGMRKKIWPALRVHVIWCDMSIGECLWASVVIRSRYEEAQPENRRPVEFHKLEDANHFVHWEEPERFVKFLAGIV
ncbi:alpha/beta-hydrolase [Pilatotrama ljubarskyi]|nr:alpha/beta-hydrolase [Pilatotrama ljubarskyi]